MSDIERYIENLSISADAKAILIDIARATVKTGGQIIRAGQRILSFVIGLVREFPNTTFGALVAWVVSSLIASIPLLGVVLGPLLGPLLLALGISAGALVDLKDRALTVRIRHLESEFASLTAQR
jgi:hypothetical protein